MTLRTLNYGNYGIFLIMGNAGFCPSTDVSPACIHHMGAPDRSQLMHFAFYPFYPLVLRRFRVEGFGFRGGGVIS